MRDPDRRSKAFLIIMSLKIEKRKEGKLTTKDLPGLQQAFYLAKEMG
nr:hypothetical protein [Zunongwangia atlantica]